jgi:ribosomal-protein-alanine N-acetyltransferase
MSDVSPAASPTIFQPPVAVETERLLLRGIEDADLTDLLVMNQDEEVTRFLPYAAWKSIDDAIAWLGRIRKVEAAGTGIQLVLVEKTISRVVGAAVIFKYDEKSSRAELGFALCRAQWGKGLMMEAMVGLITHVFKVRKLRRLEAEANPLNAASCLLLERLGFTGEGLLRQRWQSKGEPYDTRIFGLLRDEWAQVRPKAR